MQIKTFIFAGIALLGSGLSPAISGPCTAEIDALTKMLAAKDAGSGPTVGAAGQAGTPAGASAQQPSAQHPPTAVMGQETQGKATSPEDVRRQIQGQPTTAQQGMAGTAGGSDRINQANKALERARALDGQGKEAECTDTVRQAKGHAQAD
jgi:hypothetical protein